MDISGAIRSAAIEAGVDVDEQQVSLLGAHLESVMAANKEFNLTAIRDARDAVILHVLDSLLCLPPVLRAPDGVCADIGSGAGFPGIPLAICSARRFDLIESVGKKADYLATSVLALGLGQQVSVIQDRAEGVSGRRGGEYAAVVARALSSLPSLVELASPLLFRGGWLIAMKGRLTEEELRAGDSCGRLVGMKRLELHRYQLPLDDALRAYVVYEKAGESDVPLPRRDGMAQKRPLG